MPTVDGTRVRCPECGATSRTASDVVKCEYCGTESRVQKRTTVFQMAVPLPKLEPHHPVRIAKQVRTWPLLLIIIGMPIAFAILMPCVFIMRQHAIVMWVTPMYIVDVDGDGTADAIGFARYVSKDQMKLRAVSGLDGHSLWETDSLGTYTNTYDSKFRLSGTTLFRLGPGAKLEAREVKTGAKLWAFTPTEVVTELCKDRKDGVVALHLEDKTVVAVEIATGKAVAPSSLDDACDPIGGTDQPFEVGKHGFQAPGMNIEELFGAKPPYIAFGKKSPGSGTPMVAAFADDDTLLWKSEIPGRDALQADHVKYAYDDTTIVAVYTWKKDTQDPTVTAFDRATGKRLWESNATYTGKMFVTVDSIAIGKNAIFAVVEQSIQCFDPQTGKRRFVVGKSN